MPSTYTTNLGIEKLATGEQSGTWGNTTNTNLDLIDQAVNGVVQITLTGLGTSGSPNDIDIINGSASDARNKFIEFVDGGDLGGTAYVRLTPNNAEKICHIRNSLSGSRSILLFQGTYDANNDIEIENGKDYVVKFDGGGSGATVTNIFESLQVNALSVSGTTQIDSLSLNEGNITNVGDIALDSISADATDINVSVSDNSATALTIKESTTTYLTIDTTNTSEKVLVSQTLDVDDNNITSVENLEVASIKAKDGTASATIADSTGVMTIASSVLTTTDINGGTIDGVVFNEKVGTITSGALDLSSGNVFSDAPSANVTYSFSNPPSSGTAYGFTLKVTPSGSYTITWPSSIDWPEGTAPDSPASGETDVFTFYTQDGGTTYYGFQAGDAMS